MPICITCSTPVKNLYTTYSKADDRSLGKGVRLTQCPNCKRFADKYVEHDYIVLFIDLVLIKPQVYRHLLFNRLGRTDDKLDPSILRLGILLILFDVYITWARIEQYNSIRPEDNVTTKTSTTNFSNAPIITQYLFFLTLNVVATIVQHLTTRLLAQIILTRGSKNFVPNTVEATGTTIGSNIDNNSPNNPAHPIRATLQRLSSTQSLPSTSTHPLSLNDTTTNNPSPSTLLPTSTSNPFSPSSISTALLVSSCTKLFPILLVIWPTSPTSATTAESTTPPVASSPLMTAASFTSRATNYISWIVLLNNIEALLILLDCGYVVATALAVSGAAARWLVEGWLLGCVGLVRDGAWFGG